MANYMIHAMPRRMWYVEEFLIPSLLKQGIDGSSIRVYNDIEGEGNLKSCMKSFAQCEGDGGTWHLQDDVCICKDFKIRTEKYDQGIVCGFSSELYDGPGKIGEVSLKEMWFSFPCIRIPNEYARNCSEWVNKYLIGNPVYAHLWKDGANDDVMFRMYLKEYHKTDKALNLAPNLVDHVDYLLGGGTGKIKRDKSCRAQYWVDPEIVKELEDEINGR